MTEPGKGIRGQDGSQEKKELLHHQHKENAVPMHVCVCERMCAFMCDMVRWRKGQHPQPPART